MPVTFLSTFPLFALPLFAALLAADPPEAAFDVDGFRTPESVLHDAAADVYLVSNIDGAPGAKDGNGFVSRVAPDGTVLALRWIAGGANGVTLHAPKGLALSRGTLYVTDIDVVRLFDAATGAPKGQVEVPGAVFLNDAAAAPDGAVYVSDTGGNAVYRLAPDGTLSRLADGPTLARPNGLHVLPGGALAVAPFGSNETYELAASGETGRRRALPKGGLDGVVAWNGGLLLTSWEGAALYFLDAAGGVRALAENLRSPADLGLDAKRGRALVPLFDDGKVRVIPLPR